MVWVLGEGAEVWSGTRRRSSGMVWVLGEGAVVWSGY